MRAQIRDGSPSPSIDLVAVVKAESPRQSSDFEHEFESSGTAGGDQASSVSTPSRAKGKQASSPKSTPKLRSRRSIFPAPSPTVVKVSHVPCYLQCHTLTALVHFPL